MSEQNNNNGQVAVSRIDSLKLMLNAESVQAQFKNALGENTNGFVASMIELYSGDSYLQQCEPKAVIMQALKAAVLKLPVVKSLGQAFILPYKSNGVMVPQFQIGYKGFIQLAIRTGAYRFLNADIVYEGEYQSRNKLTGEFDLNGTATSDKVIGYFAHFELTTGFSKTLYMTREKVDSHAKKYSKSYNQQYSPWKTEFDKMAIKTVLTQLLTHWGFLSTEMQQAFAADNDLADQVQEEIKTKGNSQNMDFEEADVVPSGAANTVNNTMDFSNNNTPGF